ncbi:tyrosine-type recombinase/integrase [Leucobacter sp. UCMA 4100]|uniref:tyrosine-type recombinase/integrase n=1 Tax=Leucobacter sp. UCMA 4100 TaxID=2810534 RepID=UPI0022EB2140|nr:tyrosine-type recombinase/integrase [Leucobacter sp. UCMA 4100]MDA3146492.1 tyrosine-type recombinase/integrase [Leucobacter sp. UCMA 4100]
MEWETSLTKYSKYQAAAGLSERTIAGRDELLRNLISFSKVRRPQLITTEDLLDFLNRPHYRTGGPLSPGTKQVERSYLQNWTRWMHQSGYIAYDPGSRLPRVKVPRRQARPLSIEHINALMNSDIRQATRDKVTILANTGLRIGEVVRIRKSDYDWHTNSFHSSRKGGLIQTIHANSAVQEVAQRKAKERSEWWFPSPYTSSQFPNGGGHVLMKSASTAISKAMRRIGITDTRLTTHSLRHFYACILLAQGTQLHVVQQLLGHASLATTQLYIQVGEEELKQAVSQLPTIGQRIPDSHNTDSRNQLLTA